MNKNENSNIKSIEVEATVVDNEQETTEMAEKKGGKFGALVKTHWKKVVLGAVLVGGGFLLGKSVYDRDDEEDEYEYDEDEDVECDDDDEEEDEPDDEESNDD